MDSTEVKEQFCFSETTANVTSFEVLKVGITRSEPACDEALIKLTLSFDNDGATLSKFNMCSHHVSGTAMKIMLVSSADFSENCAFNPLQFATECTIDINGTNKYFENDTVPGLVTLEQENNSFCNKTEKEVIIHKCKCSYVTLEMFLSWHDA